MNHIHFQSFGKPHFLRPLGNTVELSTKWSGLSIKYQDLCEQVIGSDVWFDSMILKVRGILCIASPAAIIEPGRALSIIVSRGEWLMEVYETTIRAHENLGASSEELNAARKNLLNYINALEQPQ
ncbi:hypothetical protein [Achromobacter phage Motura]|uniref:Uncharacterized protein n=1 Tax=Achromobacter phage Motura TaxID=2591403 RepID=A0A514CT71_9CAUD|nr:hypothetical protein H1O15_gp096 [Achromobacter phage Motura]QDH83654.1 hypothetical protein [Achromobacter phage Motura]